MTNNFNGMFKKTVSVIALLGCLMVAAPAGAATSDTAFDRVTIKKMVIEEAQNSLVPVALALALAKVESDFQTNAKSTAGARGVMQIMPKNAQTSLGIDPDELWDPALNIQIGLDRLGTLYQAHGRWDLALAAYHGGGIDGLGQHAKPRLASQTYVDTVLRWRDRYKAQAAVWAKLHDREQDWYPSRTSALTSTEERPELRLAIDQSKRTLANKPDKANKEGRKRRPALVIWHEADGTGYSIEQRRAMARVWLDDFGSKPVTRHGR